MDKFTEDHLVAWIERTIAPDEAEVVETGIRQYVDAYPIVLTRGWGDSWPEVCSMARREGYIPSETG